MQKAKQRLTSLVIACVMMIVSMFAAIATLVMPQTTAVAATESTKYEKTDFGVGKLLITTTHNGKTYYLPASTTSSAPKAEVFTNPDEIGEENLFTVTADGSNYIIQNAEGKYLYATNTNNGVRVGTTKASWTYNASDNSFKLSTTNRYLGIYNAQDWRSYNSVTAGNYKNTDNSYSSKSFVFYKLKEIDDTTKPILDTLNTVQSYMNLSYKYTETKGTTTVNATEATISFANTAQRTEYSTTKQVWEQNGITVTNNKASSTTNVGNYYNPARFYKSSTITIEYPNMSTITLNSSTGEYIENLKTTLDNAQISYTVNNTTFVITLPAPTNSLTLTAGGQVRLTSLTVSGAGGDIEVTTYSDCEFRFKCAVDSSLVDLKTTYGEKIKNYGIKVTAGTKDDKYNADSVFAWESATIEVDGEEKEVFYVVISLGNLFDNPDRFDVKFTVAAFVTIDGTDYVSENSKTYSVKSMVQELYEDLEITDIEHLYNYLIKEEA